MIVKRLNERMEQDSDEVELTELQEAWRTKHPGRLWYLSDGAPPMEEVLLESAKQHFMEQGLFPEEVHFNDLDDPENMADFDRIESNRNGPITNEEFERWNREDPILRAGAEARARGEE